MKGKTGMTALIMGIVAGFMYLAFAWQAMESGDVTGALLWVTAAILLVGAMLQLTRSRKPSCNTTGERAAAPRR